VAVLAQVIGPAVGTGQVLLVYHGETKARIMPKQLFEYTTLKANANVSKVERQNIVIFTLDFL
jgi:hypothetical protein